MQATVISAIRLPHVFFPFPLLKRSSRYSTIYFPHFSLSFIIIVMMMTQRGIQRIASHLAAVEMNIQVMCCSALYGHWVKVKIALSLLIKR